MARAVGVHEHRRAAAAAAADRDVLQHCPGAALGVSVTPPTDQRAPRTTAAQDETVVDDDPARGSGR